jgi:hypothetical protein
LNDYRAVFNTGAASGTPIFDNGAGTFSDFNLEISGRSFHFFKICVGDEFDI